MGGILYSLNLLTSACASVLRLGMGVFRRREAPNPELPVELYEFEGCPHCRLVREAITELNLRVQIWPCPKGGRRYRPELVERAGKAQFPYLVDPNTGTEMYESADIIKYLFRTYGRGLPLRWWLLPLHRILSVFAALPRMGQGVSRRQASVPVEPLVLTNMESHPGARLVRERLCELELPYCIESAGLGGGRHVPTLHDANTGTELSDVREILTYLSTTYAGTHQA